IIEVADAIPSHLPNQLNYGQDIEDASSALQMQIKNAYPALAEKYPLRWLSFKLMEGDDHVYKEINIAGNGLPVRDVINHLKKAHGDDIESIMADARYAQATGLTHEVLKKPEFRKIDLTEKIDRVVLNRFLGIPIFLAAMWVVFKLVFDVSTPFIDWVDEMMAGPFPRWAEAILGVI
ncbi:ferrous iron transport protein B, partial [Candidatus Hakubella thermalkaliphila]